MENLPLHKKMAYRNAKRRVEEIRNYIMFVIAFLALAIFAKFSGYPEEWFNFKSEYIDAWIIVQGILFIIYGIFHFFTFTGNWEQKKINELMYKEKNQS